MTGPLDIYLKPKEWHDNRRKGLGGSDATILSEGNPDKIHELWLIKTRRKEPEPLLYLPVLLGVETECLNVRWFEHITGRNVWGCGEERIHPDYGWMRASLDGITTSKDSREALLEAKCVNAFSKMPSLLYKYRAQLHHSMYVGGWNVSVLSVILGNKHFYEEVEIDQWYLIELVDLEESFWRCVVDDKEPSQECFRGLV